jgi:hypothetical protein
MIEINLHIELQTPLNIVWKECGAMYQRGIWQDAKSGTEMMKAWFYYNSMMLHSESFALVPTFKSITKKHLLN